jgi:hypothetical protein
MIFCTKKTGLAGIILCISMNVFSQLQPPGPVAVPSSNATSLGVFGEVPVSKFTGVPDINIPLHTVKTHQLEAPISLNYHASGVLPDVHPGWTGLNWGLFAGGMITRNAVGAPDEIDSAESNGQIGFFTYCKYLIAPNWSTAGVMYNFAQSPYKETTPDEFDFSVNGLNGSFYLNDNGNWQVKCDRDVKVIFNANDFIHPLKNFLSGDTTTGQRAFGKFTIIGADGTNYVFGGTGNSIEYSVDFFNQATDHWVATSWYLTKIVSADGLQEIDFSYERDQYTNVLYYNSFQNDNWWVGAGCGGSTGVDNQTYSIIGGNIVSPVYLKSIETPNEKIQFDRSTSVELRYDSGMYRSTYQMYQQVYNNLVDKNVYIHSIAQDSATSGFLPLLHLNSLTTYPALLANLQWKKLDSISIYDKTLNQVIQRFRLSYNNNSAQRLMLQSIVETNPSGPGNNSKPPYLFYYDSTNALPGYLSQLVDDWGTFNGTSYLSAYDIKPASPVYAGAGTLNKIVYPTGGDTRFFFESNDFYAKVNPVRTSPLTVYPNSQLAGGLRIKAIYNFDPISQQISSKHYYLLLSG